MARNTRLVSPRSSLLTSGDSYHPSPEWGRKESGHGREDPTIARSSKRNHRSTNSGGRQIRELHPRTGEQSLRAGAGGVLWCEVRRAQFLLDGGGAVAAHRAEPQAG